MNYLSAVRKIRACEGETAAQLVLERFIAEQIAIWQQENAALRQWIKDDRDLNDDEINERMHVRNRESI